MEVEKEVILISEFNFHDHDVENMKIYFQGLTLTFTQKWSTKYLSQVSYFWFATNENCKFLKNENGAFESPENGSWTLFN